MASGEDKDFKKEFDRQLKYLKNGKLSISFVCNFWLLFWWIKFVCLWFVNWFFCLRCQIRWKKVQDQESRSKPCICRSGREIKATVRSKITHTYEGASTMACNDETTRSRLQQVPVWTETEIKFTKLNRIRHLSCICVKLSVELNWINQISKNS